MFIPNITIKLHLHYFFIRKTQNKGCNQPKLFIFKQILFKLFKHEK